MHHLSTHHSSLLKVITLLLVLQFLRHRIAPIIRRFNSILEEVLVEGMVVEEVTQATMAGAWAVAKVVQEATLVMVEVAEAVTEVKDSIDRPKRFGNLSLATPW